jgi:hypothetical protein
MDGVRFAKGIARKVSFVFIGFSFLGWLLLIAGNRKEFISSDEEDDYDYNDYDDDTYDVLVFFPLLAAIIVGLFLHMMAVVHALLWEMYSAFAASITAVLSTLYLVAVGHLMVVMGISINHDLQTQNDVKLAFAGSFLTTLFWAVHLAFWPWFNKDRYRAAVGGTVTIWPSQEESRIAIRHMKIAVGIVRKVSLIFVGLSFIGWIVFVAGFGTSRDKYLFTVIMDYFGYYSFWAASVVGPFLHILGVIHSLLWGFPGSVVGSVTAVVSVMYLTGVGFVITFFGILLAGDFNIDDGITLLFAGGLISTVFWGIYMALWSWFTNKEAVQETPLLPNQEVELHVSSQI